MLKVTFLIAGLLTIVGIVFYFLGGMAHPQALAPVVIAILLTICAVIVVAKQNWRKHVMHVALLIALLGILSMIQPLTIALQSWGNDFMLAEVIITMALCALYILIGIRLFISRRKREKSLTPA